MSSLRDDYERDGYAFPVPIMSPARATALRVELEAAEKLPAYADAAAYPHVVMPWLDELIRDDAILDPVRELLGNDLLVWGTSFFIKEANSPSFVSWHQDLHYWGLDDVHETTAWIALSPANVSSGCMRFVPGTHRDDDIAHHDTFAAQNLLSRGQEVAVEVDDSSAVDVVLAPGEMSLHHGRTLHASRGNTTNDRRIGLAIRYIPTHMRQARGERTLATLVSGEDRCGNFALSPRPESLLDAGAVALAKGAATLKDSILFATAEQASRRRAEPA